MPFKSVADEFHRWGQGKLHSGKGGHLVPHTKAGHKQAIAIALSEARRHGQHVPKPKSGRSHVVRNMLRRKHNV